MGTLVPLQANIVNAQSSKHGGDHMCVPFPAGAVSGTVVTCQGWSEAVGYIVFGGSVSVPAPYDCGDV